MDVKHEVVDDFRSSKARNRVISRLALALGILIAVFLGLQAHFYDFGEHRDRGAVAEVMEKKGYLLAKREAETVDYQVGSFVMAGDMIQTLDDATIKLTYLDGRVTLTIKPNTTIQFTAGSGGKHTNLSGGEVEYVVHSQSKEQPMKLQSYNAEAVILEPGVYIQRFADVSTHFTVKKGRLRVRRFTDGQIKEVTPGASYACKPEEGKGTITFQENL